MVQLTLYSLTNLTRSIFSLIRSSVVIIFYYYGLEMVLGREIAKCNADVRMFISLAKKNTIYFQTLVYLPEGLWALTSCILEILSDVYTASLQQQTNISAQCVN